MIVTNPPQGRRVVCARATPDTDCITQKPKRS
nr:MAG TPA: Eco57I restriction-modification methylase [Caudoviricetes sp.]